MSCFNFLLAAMLLSPVIVCETAAGYEVRKEFVQVSERNPFLDRSKN
jgi:hypothetical protein